MAEFKAAIGLLDILKKDRDMREAQKRNGPRGVPPARRYDRKKIKRSLVPLPNSGSFSEL